tara:strand:- start:135 stop:557 length:423 start_codon:yes stop_codon:yes gene_type:complete
MTKRVNTDAYMEFVNAVTSEASKNYDEFNSRCFEIQSEESGDGLPVHRLLTAALGICAEGGEFTEVVKKIVFQGKPVNEDNIFHMKRELGDIMWYVAQACMSLDTTIDEIIEMNVEKLKSRYPLGEFDVHHSENRKEGDI